jgi:hypothetical protein
MQALMEENRKAVAELLTPEQSKRLKEISLQQRGPTALTDPEVAKALDLSEDQQTKVKSINEETATAMRDLFTPGQPPDEDARKKMADLRKSSGDKLLALLSPEQKPRPPCKANPSAEIRQPAQTMQNSILSLSLLARRGRAGVRPEFSTTSTGSAL